MFKFILKRIALMFPLMIVVSFMTFLLTYITNENPAVTILHAQGDRYYDCLCWYLL